MKLIKLIKGNAFVIVGECEVGAYKKNGWTREGEKAKKKSTQNKGK